MGKSEPLPKIPLTIHNQYDRLQRDMVENPTTLRDLQIYRGTDFNLLQAPGNRIFGFAACVNGDMYVFIAHEQGEFTAYNQIFPTGSTSSHGLYPSYTIGRRSLRREEASHLLTQAREKAAHLVSQALAIGEELPNIESVMTLAQDRFNELYPTSSSL